jgi:hypothetical protein
MWRVRLQQRSYTTYEERGPALKARLEYSAKTTTDHHHYDHHDHRAPLSSSSYDRYLGSREISRLQNDHNDCRSKFTQLSKAFPKAGPTKDWELDCKHGSANSSHVHVE